MAHQFLPLLLTIDGVDLNVRDRKGFSALHLAASTNNFDAIQMIVDSYHEFDVNIQDRTGQTPAYFGYMYIIVFLVPFQLILDI